jgi:hypothetical protein
VALAACCWPCAMWCLTFVAYMGTYMGSLGAFAVWQRGDVQVKYKCR